MTSAKVLRGYKVMPLAEPIPYENMVIYKVHPRGYTMQKTSGGAGEGNVSGTRGEDPVLERTGDYLAGTDAVV